ncbi:hypothetical protein [Flavobacterium sp.]|uniref:hypothetical protein n=1 Tax=Flavobacterium sp. TaxID=239 RepID=UPI003D6B24CF
MKKYIVLVFILFTILSCKKKEINETGLLEKEKSASVLGLDCYAYNGDYSKVMLRITNVSNGVKGYLKYDLYEKDSNNGTFEGILKGDTLIADYTFQSEGVENIRKVAFLIQGNQLFEGHGEMTSDGTRFKNSKAIQFSKAMPLSEVECKGSADCPADFGFLYSELKKECIYVKTVSVVLNPLKNGMATTEPKAYVLFSDDTAKAELFLPNETKNIILSKTSEGNWAAGDYKLMAWKGYVLQYKDKPVYGGQ